ncbi:TonB-dependent receptor [Brevundimonas sp. GCM10030266]|uniref:TonB-dependent receptor n=1 Tax=Brevundimonas sp. GCM10030266 TaxID=3273386 RepID=UPI00360B34EC
MLLVTTALSGLMAGVIQTAPTPPQTPPQQPPAPATAPTAEDDEAYELSTVTVSAARPRGSVDTDIPADVTLDASQIQAYGASNIAELMTYLEPLTRSSSGRTDLQPVFLVNGRRISGFQEIQGIPTEAIERTEILPEQVALQFGYRAEQRVVNFVLKANFSSYTGELTGRGPTQGGRTTTEIEGNVLHIAGANRWSMDAEFERSSPLFESERNLTRDGGSTPYDLLGNVTSTDYTAACFDNPATCTVIDPALGTAITPVPGGTTTPTLADFLAGAAGGGRTGDLGAYRTLLAESERATVRGTMKRDLNSTTQLTVSGSLEDTSSRSFNGLPGLTLNLPSSNDLSPFANDVLVHRYIDDAGSLVRETEGLNGKLAVVADGYLGEDWRWTATGSYERTETDTVTGRGYSATAFNARLAANDPTANPFGALGPTDFTRTPNDTANSVSQQLGAEVVLNGDLYELPAGSISSTFKFGADTRSLDSTSTRLNTSNVLETIDRSQSRDRFNGQGTFNFPIASRRNGTLEALGDLSVNATLGYEELSDFGGLSSYNIGVNWSPIEPLSFLVSYADEQGAPSISQLNDPTIATPNTPVFDFRTGETVFVTRTTGGNPNLNADNRQVWRVGGTWRPLSSQDLSIQSTWTYSRTDDYLASFPAITPDLEAALPGRFTRDTDGNLTAIDARPLNFQKYERQDIRTGINYSRAFGTPSPAASQSPLPGLPGGPRPPGGGGSFRIEGGGGGGGPRTEVRMGGGPGGGGRGRGASMQPGQGRWNISLFHTVRLQDELTIADGLPVIDQLDGGAISASGGSPRNEFQLMSGVFRNGFGGFMFATWREGTTINGGTGPDISFADRTTVNLNLFMDLNQRTSWVEKYPILKGTRIQFGIQNLFDSRPEASTSSGDLPLNYQSDYLDPQGRVVSLTLRKILF